MGIKPTTVTSSVADPSQSAENLPMTSNDPKATNTEHTKKREVALDFLRSIPRAGKWKIEDIVDNVSEENEKAKSDRAKDENAIHTDTSKDESIRETMLS